MEYGRPFCAGVTDPIEHQRMQVNVQIGRRARVLKSGAAPAPAARILLRRRGHSRRAFRLRPLRTLPSRMAPRIVSTSGRSTARFNPSGSCSGTFENQDLVSGWLGSSVWSGLGNRLRVPHPLRADLCLRNGSSRHLGHGRRRLPLLS